MPFIRDNSRINNIHQSRILDLTDEMSLEECAAVERYCVDYQAAYTEAKDKGLSVVTIVSVE